MKYGAMNLPTRPILEEIEAIGKLRFDYIELTIDAPESTPEKILKQQDDIRDLLSSCRMEVVGHLPTFISIADLYESIRQVSIEENFKALEAGVAIGIKKFVIHPPTIRGLGRQVKDKAKKYGEKSLEAIINKANELKVILCIENMFPETGGPVDPNEFDAFFSKHPELRFTLDVAHAHIGTKKNRSSAFIKRFAGKLLHLHISDNYGRDDAHLPIGAGMIFFWRIFKELKMIGYNETMTLEVFSRDRDYLKISRDKIRQMWESA